jgi:hypothetical protein
MKVEREKKNRHCRVVRRNRKIRLTCWRINKLRTNTKSTKELAKTSINNRVRV